jgi:hypothetical protein
MSEKYVVAEVRKLNPDSSVDGNRNEAYELLLVCRDILKSCSQKEFSLPDNLNPLKTYLLPCLEEILESKKDANEVLGLKSSQKGNCIDPWVKRRNFHKFCLVKGWIDKGLSVKEAITRASETAPCLSYKTVEEIYYKGKVDYIMLPPEK